MTHVGVDAEAQGWLWRLLGALLLLGQLDFGEAEGLAEAQLAEPEVLQTFCDLLQLDCEPMQRARPSQARPSVFSLTLILTVT